MDPTLLKQQADFKARAMRTIETTQRDFPSTSHSTYDPELARKKKKRQHSDVPTKSTSTPGTNSGNSAASSLSAANFGTMAKIVDYMKWSLTLKEILEELQLYDLGKKTETWLQEALPTNPRITVDEDGKFVFKPPHKVKGKNSLLALLKKYHTEAKGGILLTDLNECIPAAEKHIEALGNAVIDVTTVINKRKDHVYFYNDAETDHVVDESFKNLWRNASVEHLEEKKIEEYLQKHGIDVLKDMKMRHKVDAIPKRKVIKRKNNVKLLNQHVADVLEDYHVE